MQFYILPANPSAEFSPTPTGFFLLLLIAIPVLLIFVRILMMISRVFFNNLRILLSPLLNIYDLEHPLKQRDYETWLINRH